MVAICWIILRVIVENSLDEDAVSLLMLYKSACEDRPTTITFLVGFDKINSKSFPPADLSPDRLMPTSQPQKCRCGPGDLHHSLILTGDT